MDKTKRCTRRESWTRYIYVQLSHHRPDILRYIGLDITNTLNSPETRIEIDIKAAVLISIVPVPRYTLSGAVWRCPRIHLKEQHCRYPMVLDQAYAALYTVVGKIGDLVIQLGNLLIDTRSRSVGSSSAGSICGHTVYRTALEERHRRYPMTVD